MRPELLGMLAPKALRCEPMRSPQSCRTVSRMHGEAHIVYPPEANGGLEHRFRDSGELLGPILLLDDARYVRVIDLHGQFTLRDFISDKLARERDTSDFGRKDVTIHLREGATDLIDNLSIKRKDGCTCGPFAATGTIDADRMRSLH